MTGRTWLLSGIPRSGSSLGCMLAGELPDTVALSEPIRQEEFSRVESADEACLRIEEFVRQVRERILVEGRAPSIQRGGKLDDNMVAGEFSADGLRVGQVSRGEIEVHKALSGGFTLFVKHNALFAALLPRLTGSFECLAMVRNPLAVLASWQTVNLPVQQGRIPAGERFDTELNAALMGEPDSLRRQIAVLNWFFARFLSHLERESVIRYEDLVSSGGAALFRRMGRNDAGRLPLENRNANPLYRGTDPEVLMEALTGSGGEWSEFYDAPECERLAETLRAGQ